MMSMPEYKIFTTEECDILCEALRALKHRNLCIMTDYGTKAINGRKASEELDKIDKLIKEIYPETTRGRRNGHGVRETYY